MIRCFSVFFLVVTLLFLGVVSAQSFPSYTITPFPVTDTYVLPVTESLGRVIALPFRFMRHFIGLRDQQEETKTSFDGEDAQDYFHNEKKEKIEEKKIQALELSENEDPWLTWPSFAEDLGQEGVFIEQDQRGFLADVFDNQKEVENMISPYEAMVSMPYTIAQFKHASGNWLGIRDQLSQEGVNFSTTYTSNFAGNPIGGAIRGGFTYVDSYALGLLFDTEKLFKWKGGHILMSGLQADGENLSAQYIHNIFNAQQADKGKVYKWYELSLQQSLWKDQADIKIGRFGAADDFEISPLYWLYMNNAIDGRVLAFRLNSHLPANPLAAWGARLKVNTSRETVARAGIFQINAKPSLNGLNWNFYPNDGLGLIAQFSWNPEFPNPLAPRQEAKDKSAGTFKKEEKIATEKKAMPKGLPGHYFTGGYCSSWNFPNFNAPGTTTPYGYGIYAHADQMLYRPNPFTDEGLILWSATNFSPQQNIALLPFQINGGAIYTGLIPGRPSDFTILGTGYGMISDDFAQAAQARGRGNPTYEWMMELGYRVHFTDFAYFQPDMEYIVNPGGTGHIPNALVVGGQVGIIF